MNLEEVIKVTRQLETVYLSSFINTIKKNIDSLDYDKIFKCFDNLKEIRGYDSKDFKYFKLLNISNIESIEIGDYFENKIQLPNGIEYAKSLKKLFINNYVQIKELPDAIFNFKFLEELHIHGWRYNGNIPDEITKLAHLKFLKLPKKMPNITKRDVDKVFGLPQLEYLSIRCFSNKIIDSKISQLHNLKEIELVLGRDYMPYLKHLSSLKNLEVIISKRLNTIPDSFTQLQKLKYFGVDILKKDEFNNTVDILAQLSGLRKLMIYSRLEILDSILKLKQITHINLINYEDLNITRTFDIFSKLPQLNELKIHVRDLNSQKAIYLNISKIKKLKKLSITFNFKTELMSLFKVLQKLESLEVLKIEGKEKINVLDNLPVLNKLRHIEMRNLNSSKENMQKFFIYLSKVPHLKVLIIHNIDIIPDNIVLLSHLECLDVRNCDVILEYLRLKEFLPDTKIII